MRVAVIHIEYRDGIVVSETEITADLGDQDVKPEDLEYIARYLRLSLHPSNQVAEPGHFIRPEHEV